ncbi:uromodulin-like [Protopterus annectens]|uniref:uromodulin-like n=1 Tax=Protopterus annectens TaxID=7888 RepID=UPI001CF9519A|nr:uromodulin-like [Protopterus annectens]
MKAHLWICCLSLMIYLTQGQTCSSCFPDQVCVNSSCVCDPAIYTNPDLVTLLETQRISCAEQQFNITISGCTGRMLIIEGSHLPNSTCVTANSLSSRPGETVFTFTLPPLNPLCNAWISVNNTHVTYTTSVLFQVKPINGIIIYNDVNVYYNCSYPLNMKTSLDLAINPVLSTSNITITGVGQYTVKMALFKTADYTSPYLESDSPIHLKVEDFMYIGAFVTGISEKFALKLDACYGTQTNNSKDSIKYYFIQNSCPVSGGVYVSIIENGNSSQARIAVKVFKYAGSNEVFLTCSASLCVKPCVLTCPSGRAELSDESQTAVLTPNIQILQEKSSDYPESAAGSFHAVSSWISQVYTLLTLLLLKYM